jgi:hypothetical protein
MAIDTRNKRAMVIGFDSPYLTLLPVPDGAIAEADRYQLARKYHIPFVAPAGPGKLVPVFRVAGPFFPAIGGA